MTKEITLNVRMTSALNTKLAELARQTGKNRAEILRALLAGATLEHLPPAWVDPAQAAVLAEAE